MVDHRTDDPDTRAGTPSYPGLQVDLDGIDDFVAALRHEIDENLRPGIHELIQSFEAGVGFGIMAFSPNVVAAQRYYRACLARASRLLADYAAAGEALASAAERMARRYRETDAMIAADAQTVADALADAAAPRPTQDPPPASPHRSPT